MIWTPIHLDYLNYDYDMLFVVVVVVDSGSFFRISLWSPDISIWWWWQMKQSVWNNKPLNIAIVNDDNDKMTYTCRYINRFNVNV